MASLAGLSFDRAFDAFFAMRGVQHVRICFRGIWDPHLSNGSGSHEFGEFWACLLFARHLAALAIGFPDWGAGRHDWIFLVSLVLPFEVAIRLDCCGLSVT
jgi:hypothetical protein